MLLAEQAALLAAEGRPDAVKKVGTKRNVEASESSSAMRMVPTTIVTLPNGQKMQQWKVEKDG